MSTRLFQNVIGQYRGTVDRVFGILDDDGNTVACSVPVPPADIKVPDFTSRIISGLSEKYISGGYTFRLIGQGSAERYFIYVEGTDTVAEGICGILAVSFTNMKRLYDDRYDRSAFIRSIILDNILPEDIRLRAKDMRMLNDDPRAVFILHTEGLTGSEATDILQNMFPDRQRDFVIPVSQDETVFVKTLKSGSGDDEVHGIAVGISDTFSTELFMKIKIGVSGICTSLTGLPDAYREATTALEVSEIFIGETGIAEYGKLGIGRLIYMLPTPLCRKYIGEVFRKDGIDSLEPEILTTIQAFFDNSLNISETSRKLFIHRNTLIYRLEKIQKLTGLDLRNFDDAITFRMALMVNRYLESRSRETKE